MDFKEAYQAIHHATAVFILLLVLTRLIGKKLLGQITFFDFVMGITLGTIGGAYVTTEVKGYYVLLGAAFLTFLVMITGFLTLRNVTARKLIEGEPIIMIQNGKILEENMGRIRYNVDDLLMQLREKDVFDPNEVDFAILEPHGKLTVLKKGPFQNVLKKDLNIKSTYKGVSTELIRDGRIQEQNLIDNNLTHEWLYNQLSSKNIKDINHVFLATLNADDSLYVDSRHDNIPKPQRVEEDDSIIK